MNRTSALLGLCSPRLSNVFLSLALLLALGVAGSATAQVPEFPGWRTQVVEETGTYFNWLYPAGVEDPDEPLPVIVFLHGSGTQPRPYLLDLLAAGDAARAVVIAPKSKEFAGWGVEADRVTLAAALAFVGDRVPLDPERVSIAGHSAGGAWAYLLAYSDDTRWNAVFSMAAPHYQILSLPETDYVPPIRMYYGTADPNYQGGSHNRLVAQWQRLGVPSTSDIQPGYGHGSWPIESLIEAFEFLVSVERPSTSGGGDDTGGDTGGDDTGGDTGGDDTGDGTGGDDTGGGTGGDDTGGDTGSDDTGGDDSGPCIVSDTTLCLAGGRFQVEISWRTAEGGTGVGSVVPGATDDSGLFWFFRPSNWELLVKLLDGCAINDRFWVYSAATTDVGYDLVITDLDTGTTRTWSNPLGVAAPAVTDTDAFPCS